MTFAVIAACGTGGHIYPGLALADELVRRDRGRRDIRFIGGRRGLEHAVVSDAGFEIDTIPGRGLQRSLHPMNFVALAQAVAAVPRGVRLLRRHRPEVVIGFGGYASFGALIAARGLGIPTIVHEQNAAPGLTNRILVRLGAHAASSIPDTPLRGAVVTGNPVRGDVLAVTRDPVSPPLVSIVGGSLGARRVNDAAIDLYDRWRDRDDVAIRHVSGSRDHDLCRTRMSSQRRVSDRLDYQLVEYESDMAALYRDTTVLVGRAGASTVAELTAVGLPAVLVPLPGAPGDHQSANARALAAVRGGLVVEDAACSGSVLDEMLSPLIATPDRLVEMGQAAGALGRRAAASDLADLVEAVAR